MPPRGLANRRSRLDRVHVVDRRRREHLANQRDFRRRSAVEVADPARPQRAQYARFGIALHGVKCAPRKAGDERPGGCLDDPRAQAMQRLVRRLRGDDRVHARQPRNDIEATADRRYGGFGQYPAHRCEPSRRCARRDRFVAAVRRPPENPGLFIDCGRI